MATAKKTNSLLSGSAKANPRQFLVLLAAIIVIGVIAFFATHAATRSTGTALYFSNDYRDLNVTQGVTIVDSKIYMLGGQGNAEKVIRVAPGGYFDFGGYGAAYPNPPAFKSGKECYVIKAVNGPATVSLAAGTTTQTFALKDPNGPYPNAGWQYLCVPYTTSGSYPTYVVKNISATNPVDVFHQDWIMTYNY